MKCVVILAVLTLVSSALGQVPAPIPTGPVGGPPILRDVGIDHHEGDSVPFDATFRDENDQSVRLAQYFGQKPVILALVYYRCPMLCTMVLNDLTRTLNSLPTAAGNDFTVLAVSFDPSETPELAAAKQRQYLRAYRRPHAEQGWHFLTGPRESISRLTAAAGFRYAWDAKNQQWAHSSGLIVLTPDGRISRYFYGIDYAPNDLRLALAEAGEQKISQPVSTRVLLYCFHYDPASGKYGLAIMRLLQTGGVLVLIALGGSIWFTLRRDRRTAWRAFPMGATEASQREDKRTIE